MFLNFQKMQFVEKEFLKVDLVGLVLIFQDVIEDNIKKLLK